MADSLRLAFYAPDGTGDKLLVAAVMGGAARHRDHVKFIPIDQYDGVDYSADVVACYGVRASTRIITEAYRRAGKRSLFFDKGYWGRGIYTRVAVDAWQPTKYFRCNRPGDRLKASGLYVEQNSYETENGFIIYAATTQTWHDFYDLGPARSLDEIIVRLLAITYPGRVLYRPRPAYAKKHPELCAPIDNVVVSHGNVSLADELRSSSILVTLGSNAAVEAIAAGFMVQVLGDNPCSLLNGDTTFEQRKAFLADLAYCQWTLDEYHSGEAWANIKSVMGAA